MNAMTEKLACDTIEQPSRVTNIPWRSTIPFVAVHLLCLWAFYTGVTWELVALAVGSYYLRMFAITAGYHRYFSHRSYKTSRVFQFFLAVLAMTSAQKGVLWWAAHHRHHQGVHHTRRLRSLPDRTPRRRRGGGSGPVPGPDHRRRRPGVRRRCAGRRQRRPPALPAVRPPAGAPGPHLPPSERALPELTAMPEIGRAHV